jgi:hypothetical protein
VRLSRWHLSSVTGGVKGGTHVAGQCERVTYCRVVKAAQPLPLLTWVSISGDFCGWGRQLLPSRGPRPRLPERLRFNHWARLPSH